MAASRIYEYDTTVTTPTQPVAGTPSLSSDLVPKSYLDSQFGTIVEDEVPSGDKDNVNETFTLAHTPLAAWPFHLMVDGVKLTYTTDYTRSGVTITIPGGLSSDQKPTADYRY